MRREDTSGVAQWSALREKLASVESSVTLTWQELDILVGGLPKSAHQHRAFWAGDRPGWSGFRTTSVKVGDEVTFIRVGTVTRQRPQPASSATLLPTRVLAPEDARHGANEAPADIVLISCGKTKVNHPVPARDLYVSVPFRKARAYAERSGAPWFILSAKHRLVKPDEILEPYDLRLADTSRAYRAEWAAIVVERLREFAGPLEAKRVEVLAGEDYLAPIRSRLRDRGAVVLEPLHGLTQGRRLVWFDRHSVEGATHDTAPDVAQLMEQLSDEAAAATPAEFVAAGPAGLRCPGVYSWWVSAEGAADLTRALGHKVCPGLVYAGLAGATRSRSGTASQNTLWGRVKGMHLGGPSKFSTFRLTLGSVLAEAAGRDGVDEQALTDWMRRNLRVVAVPVDDADSLERVEGEVLRRLDPPLNLSKVAKNALRTRLTELRRQHSRGRAEQARDQHGCEMSVPESAGSRSEP